MLDLDGVSFAYHAAQAPAVENVSLHIGKGEFIALAGRNGSGKTTLTKLIMSLIKPSAGSILLNGANTSRLTPADMARTVGYVFQNPDRQIFRDTVRAEIAYGPEMLGFSAERLEQATAEAMTLVGVAEIADHYPRTLTKSQKQQVAIASALAMQPDCLILDEPTSGQDAVVRERFMQLLTKLHQAGKTIILVTHDMECLVRYAKRAVIMDCGRIAYDGPVTDCFANADSIRQAGLREPAAVSISRGLAGFGVKMATSISGLNTDIIAKRGEMHV